KSRGWLRHTDHWTAPYKLKTPGSQNCDPCLACMRIVRPAWAAPETRSRSAIEEVPARRLRRQDKRGAACKKHSKFSVGGTKNEQRNRIGRRVAIPQGPLGSAENQPPR